MARPTALTPAVQHRLVMALSLSATYKLAAAYAGISVDALSNWLKRAATGEEPYAALAAAIAEAEGIAAVGLLAKIEQAANDGTWQAAAWKLERRWPQEFGRRSLELVGKDGDNLSSNVIIYLPQKDVPDPADEAE